MNSIKRAGGDIEDDQEQVHYQLPKRSRNNDSISWVQIKKENLDLSYMKSFLTFAESREFFARLEKEIQYFTGQLTKVLVFGKWHDIPRQQAAFGDEGLSYKFSNLTVPALPWTPALQELRTCLENTVPFNYNFCLVNRYRNGNDSMGEHRDDEVELDNKTPIASISLGQHRDFVFRHKDCRSKNSIRKIEPVKMVLENGSLLLMNWPTNKYWYHSLPVRKKLPGIRVNLTFRRIVK